MNGMKFLSPDTGGSFISDRIQRKTMGKLLITNGDEIICLDIRPYLQEIKEKGSGEQKETAENMTYRVNENRILHFVWINYYWGKDPHFMSEGYLLEK